MTEEDAFEFGIVEVYGPLAKRPRLKHIPPLSDDTAHALDIPPQIRDVQDPVVGSTDDEPIVSQLPTPLSQATASKGNLCPDPVIANDTGPLPSFATPSTVDLPNDGSANGPNVDLPAKGDFLRTHFADFLRSLGFTATRYDRNVWIRAREEKDGYDYICTHVDAFKFIAHNPEHWKGHISATCLLKSIGPQLTIWATITNSLKRKARGSSVVRHI